MKNSTLTEDKAEQTSTGGVLVGKREGQTIIHNKGTLSGYLVGKTHAEGGIKAVNKSTGQPLEMQGGEVVITAPAVSDNTKREFEGKMMTNREILSAINEKGGGVAFASGGDVPKSIKHTGASYKYGGKTMTDHEIMMKINGGHLAEGYSLREIANIHQVPLSDLKEQVIMGMKAESEHTPSKREQMKIVKDHLFENPEYYTLLKKAGLNHGGRVHRGNLVRDAKSGNTPARDLNNYNDVLDIDADGMVGAETSLYVDGGKLKRNGFINEELDQDLKAVYQNRAYKNIGGLDFYFSRLNIYPLQNVFTIEIPNGTEIGRATLNEKGNYLTNIRVNENYRRKGLASNLYNYIEYVIDSKLKPSPDKISKEAESLWIKRNPNINFELGGIFHGSPYNFDKFTTSKMGSGIGRQEDGWGIYLTDSKEATKNYGKYIYETTLFKNKSLGEYNFIDLKKPVKKDIVIKILKAVYKKYNKDFDIIEFNQYYDYIKDKSLPKVDFNDYDLVEFDYAGYLFYKTLSRILGGDKNASLFLLDNGIDGLKASFENSKGVYRTDYIIFDENAITIENKEYLPNNYYADGGLIAPNGHKTNLTPEQYKLVRTPAFKEWFGDWENEPENASKVVDENGEPLVVYHGTYVENPFYIFDFDKADLGFHFGTYEQAKNRSETKLFFKGRKSIVNSFFLNIKTIFESTDIGEWEYPQRYIDMFVSDGLISESDAKKNGFYRLVQREENKQIREYLLNKYGKFGGFVYNNKYEGKGNSFIVLNPNQIKLADGTNTTFDSINEDIRYATGGDVKPYDANMEGDSAHLIKEEKLTEKEINETIDTLEILYESSTKKEKQDIKEAIEVLKMILNTY